MILEQIGNRFVRARDLRERPKQSKSEPTDADRMERVAEHQRRVSEELRKLNQ